MLPQYPKYYLMSNPQTADWHEFGMEWKEHIAWLVPMPLTAAWAVLHLKWKRRNASSPRTIAIVSSALILLALIMTFPAFFGLFG